MTDPASTSLQVPDLALGDASAAYEAAVERARDEDWATRLFDRDVTLWSTDPDVGAAIAERLGWLDAPEHFTRQIPGLEGFGDGVVEYGLALRRDITRTIRRHRPEVIVGGAFAVRMIGGVTNQADHRAVGLATLDAARDAGNRWIFPELRDEGLEPWPGVRYVCLAGAAEPNVGVDVTGFLDRGIASLQAHRVYMEGLGAAAFDPAEFLSWMAAGSGERMGVDAAVLFDLHTLIPDDTPPWATGSQA